MMPPLRVFAAAFAFVALGFATFAQPTAPTAPALNAGRGGASPATTLATALLAQGDRNADAKLAREEFTALADAWFDRLDPDRLGRVGQEEFLQRFDAILSPQGGGRRGGRGVAATGNALGFFIATDQNRDASLGRDELKQVFVTWFTAWDADKNGQLEPAELTKGLNLVLPRTNMSGANARETQDPIPGLPTPPPSPSLSAQESMSVVRLADGFKLELAASEPMIEDPIALSFDEDGRAYVLEMVTYMLDIERAREREPLCRITRLEDTDGDGRFDKSTVFVDKLILPRVVAVGGGGVFYVSDYQLYFARDTDGDGKADRTELVDADYGRGNVEHAPNAFFRAMDNWVYNGESPWRYRLVRGTLVKQATEVRGQWGMTQDNYGRLLYNVNNSQLMGDFTPPNYMSRNAHHASSAGLNLFVSTDQRVFPLRMNTAINRGYSPEVLDPSGKTYVFASSCSPVVYRGDNFPAEFVGNAFVADPAVNLIKRNLVFDRNLTLTSRFAYEDREFLASTDERFRPVSLYPGPDGALWFVDLYRGVAQYGQFMTSYLRRETLARGLDKGIHYGRIYRIVSTAKPVRRPPRLSQESSAALVARLADPNGWTRDTAQRLLVERGDRSVAPALTKLLETDADPLARIHALWTLEGLFVELPSSSPTPAAAVPETAGKMIRLLSVENNFAPEAPALPPAVLNACLKAIGDANPKVQVAAIRVTESLTARHAQNQRALFMALERLGPATAAETLFQAALTAGNLPKPDVLPLLARIASQLSEHLLIRDAAISGLQDWELQFLQLVLADPQWNTQQGGRSAMLQALASAIVKEREPVKIDMLLTLAASQPPEQAWRQGSLLEGIAANAAVRPLRPIAFARPPAALATLAKSDRASIRQQAESIQALFAWPGHQTEETNATPARALSSDETSLIENGKTIFQQLCAGCHGLAGQGITPLAPPLLNSDWVLGAENRLIRIALQGVTGPITVNGTVYQPPSILPEMPALATLDDTQIAGVLSFIRRTWGHNAAPISPAQVGVVRRETVDRKSAWTEAQLTAIK